jgi:hypothetical protein
VLSRIDGNFDISHPQDQPMPPLEAQLVFRTAARRSHRAAAGEQFPNAPASTAGAVERASSRSGRGLGSGGAVGVLGAPLDALLETVQGWEIATPIDASVHLVGERIRIGKKARIAPGATLEGPLWVGEDVEIRAGAYVRGGCWIGDGSRIGANTEVKARSCSRKRKRRTSTTWATRFSAETSTSAPAPCSRTSATTASRSWCQTAPRASRPVAASWERCSATASRPAATACCTPA